MGRAREQRVVERTGTRQIVQRTRRGSMLVLILAMVLGIVLVLALVGLLYSRFTASHQEQKTAIEAATLAAAGDLSRIVIEDPYFGFVSLSDAAPIGTATAAKDGYSMPVQSINTILATVRLDMIIADQLQAPIMQQMALRDYGLAMSTVDSLNTELAKDVQPGARGMDMNGKAVQPYQDAIDAYETNIIRIMGPRTRLLPGTFKITLGYIDSIPTDMPIPQPTSAASVNANQQLNNCYLAYQNVQYDNHDFYFAATGQDTVLVDQKKFQTSMPSLKYSVPSIVKCEGDQTYQYTDARGRQATSVIHAAACAEPPCLIDSRPHPGALSYSLPNGLVPGVNCPASIFASNSPCDLLQTPPQGDYPETPLVDTQINGAHPPLDDVMQVALYDWVRLAGPHANVQAVVDMLTQPFNKTLGATAQVHLYEVTPQGSVNYTLLPAPPPLSTRVSNDQWTGISGNAAGYQVGLVTSGTAYDVQIRDDVYQPGRIRGGIHGGQPLANQLPQTGPAATSMITMLLQGQPAYARQIDPPPPQPFPAPTGNGVRPTYNTVGQAVDITVRLHAGAN